MNARIERGLTVVDAGRTDGQRIRAVVATLVREAMHQAHRARRWGTMLSVDRTDRRLRLLVRLFVIPGLVSASYLTYAKLAHVAVVCTGGCDVITTSKWSEVGGIPVTLIGMITYVLIFGSTFITSDAGRLAAAFFATTGAAFSLFLQYQALGVLRHFCPWCMTSAVCMLVLAGLTVTRLLRLQVPEPAEPTAA